MGDLTELTAREIRDGVGKGAFTAREVAQAHLAKIEKEDGKIHAFLHVMKEEALAAADAVDAKKGKGLGPLAGVPVALKDNLCTKGIPTTCASRILEGWRPPYDATVVERLKAADAILIGKTNLDEFAMGSSTENSAFGPTRNPHDLTRTPGGSSGGSAAAVAAHFAPLALGSDTGGSIRQPAACCGVVGMKPTYGAVSRYGLVAFASSLDQIGPFARNVEDAGLCFNVITGKRDPRDSTNFDFTYSDETGPGQLDPKRFTLGIPREYLSEGLDPECRDAFDHARRLLEKWGCRIVEIQLPHAEAGIPTYYLVATVEAASNLARYDGVHFSNRRDGSEFMAATRGAGFGPEVKRRIILGTFASSAGYSDQYYVQALKVRRLIRNDFDDAFKACDAILCPTTPTPAFKLGEKTADPIQMYLSDVFTVTLNLAGLPGVAVPCGKTKSGLPLSVQIIAPPKNDRIALSVAHWLEIARWQDSA